MSLPLTKSYSLYVNSRRVLLRQRELFRSPHVSSAGEWSVDARNLSELDLSAFGKRGFLKPPLRVFVGAAWVKFMVMPRPQTICKQEELIRIAQSHMTAELGLDATQWLVAVNIATTGATMIACAMDRIVIDSVRRLARESGFNLTSCTSYPEVIWNAMRRSQAKNIPSGCALLAIEEDAYTTWIERGNAIESARAMAHRQDADLAQRELLRLQLALGDANLPSQLALATGIEAPDGVQTMTLPVSRPDSKSVLHEDFRDLLLRDPGPRT